MQLHKNQAGTISGGLKTKKELKEDKNKINTHYSQINNTFILVHYYQIYFPHHDSCCSSNNFKEMKTSGCNYKDYVLLNVQRIVKVKVKISKMKMILQKNKNIYLHVMGYW